MDDLVPAPVEVDPPTDFKWSNVWMLLSGIALMCSVSWALVWAFTAVPPPWNALLCSATAGVAAHHCRRRAESAAVLEEIQRHNAITHVP